MKNFEQEEFLFDYVHFETPKQSFVLLPVHRNKFKLQSCYNAMTYFEASIVQYFEIFFYHLMRVSFWISIKLCRIQHAYFLVSNNHGKLSTSRFLKCSIIPQVLSHGYTTSVFSEVIAVLGLPSWNPSLRLLHHQWNFLNSCKVLV